MAHCDGKIDLVSKPDKLTGKGKHNAHLSQMIVRMIYYGGKYELKNKNKYELMTSLSTPSLLTRLKTERTAKTELTQMVFFNLAASTHMMNCLLITDCNVSCDSLDIPDKYDKL